MARAAPARPLADGLRAARHPPGIYRELAQIVSSNAGPVEFWLEATVYDFELPVIPPSRPISGSGGGRARRVCAHGLSGDAAALESAYLRTRSTTR